MDFGLDPNANASSEYRLGPVRFWASRNASPDGAARTSTAAKLDAARSVREIRKLSARLEAAAQTISQIEDLLNSTLDGLRENATAQTPWLANQRLLSSAEATASDLAKSSNFEGDHLFVDQSQNLATRKALHAYAAQRDRTVARIPAAEAAIRQTAQFLNGPNGVLQTLAALADAGSPQQISAEPLLSRLAADMRTARETLDYVRTQHLAPMIAGVADDPRLDTNI